MIPLATAIFLASVLGSLHCAGMCGAFLAFAVGTDVADGSRPAKTRSRAQLQAAYHLGRLATYTTLGAVAGGVGAALDLGGSLVGVQRTAAVLAGAMMIVFGILAVLRVRGVHLPKAPVPGFMRRALMAGHRRAFDLPPLRRAALVGLLTTLLPCGWLYAFVITSAGTGHPANGAFAMAAFWVGTLPVMIALGTGIQTLTGALRNHIPMLTSLALVAVGLFTVVGRLAVPAAAAAVVTVPRSQAEATETVRSLDSEKMPCCGGDE